LRALGFLVLPFCTWAAPPWCPLMQYLFTYQKKKEELLILELRGGALAGHFRVLLHA